MYGLKFLGLDLGKLCNIVIVKSIVSLILAQTK